MPSFILMVTTAIALQAPPTNINFDSAQSAMARALHGDYIVAQQYAGNNPHGSDPHGPDPHDEQHDGKLPANTTDSDRVATDDVTGGVAGSNGQKPYHGP